MEAMNVVFAIPVATDDIEQAGRTFALWHERGYRTAALIDPESAEPKNCDFLIIADEYRGWASAVNQLCAAHPKAEWIVTGGADILPDPDHTAGDIASLCNAHFGGTFGVMQPAGDKYGALAGNATLAAVSPWMGREWRQRINGGRGPVWDGYWHFWGDSELAAVAERVGAFWLNPNVKQYHDHWARRGERQPAHLQRAAQMNAADKDLYHTRLAHGFPGYNPL